MPLTRGIFAGGNLSITKQSEVIDYVQFSSLGSAVDFGDLSAKESGDAINFGGNVKCSWWIRFRVSKMVLYKNWFRI